MSSISDKLPTLRQRAKVIGTFIDVISWTEAKQLLMKWARARESRYVCICNVHSVVTAIGNGEYRRVVESADMATPDGAPVAWTLRRKGFAKQERINGPDLMWRLCADAEMQGIGIGLFGATQDTLNSLNAELLAAYPLLQITYCVSPPFRPLSVEEDDNICRDINRSGIGLLFVGLGCPRQEAWISDHRGKINAVMLGVGAAFDYHARKISRAPMWMRASGLEWFHRLCSEPRRLWKRYLSTNSLFMIATARDFMSGGFRSRQASRASEAWHESAKG
jgi:N-acetylglucosaminyldiphosphoundecaprenol N-acetyl-beta-D-mannosaminyltransferase